MIVRENDGVWVWFPIPSYQAHFNLNIITHKTWNLTQIVSFP